MTTITLPRATVEQALEALWYYRATEFGRDTPAGKAIAALHAALAQQAETVAAVAENATTQQRAGETPPSDYRRGYWDGFEMGKREGRIAAEDAAKQAEPVEPQPTTSMAEIERLRAERDALAQRLREMRALLTDTTDAHRRKVVMNAWAEQKLARHGISMPEGDSK